MTGVGAVWFDRRVRLLTLNALMKDDVRPRLRFLAGRLAGYDVVCLQEVMYRANARLLQRLAAEFPFHAYTGAVLLQGGLVTLSKMPITSARFVRFPMTPPVRPEFLMRKGAQVLTIGPLTVVNTHLSANRDDDFSVGNRFTRLQRGELAVLAGVISGPTVLVGDLNVPRSSPILADFLAAAGLEDSRAGDPEPTYRPTTQWPNPPAFDHVLLTPGLSARTRLVFQDEQPLPGVYVSDHYGIAAEVL